MMTRHELRHSISGTFVFLLLGTFAVFSTLLVLLSAQAYRDIVDLSAKHNDARVACNFVLNAVRGNDGAGVISVEQNAGRDMLVIRYDYDGETYATRIYCEEGYLKELFARDDYEIGPEDGETIVPVQAFLPELDGNLLILNVTDNSGETHTMHMALKCAGGEAMAE